MRPYYTEPGITIYHGDCREILFDFSDQQFDLVLTDPPYGIASIWQGGTQHGWGKAHQAKSRRNAWDHAAPSVATFEQILRVTKDAVIWGGNYFPSLPMSRGWFVWNKPERGFTLGEAELAWTTRNNVIRVFDAPRSEAGRLHPTQKPRKLMTWCLSFFPDARSVCDPFMGSGTTLWAAKELGRNVIGIDSDECNCEIAVNRLRQGVLPLTMEA